MTQIVTINNATLYLGDCREVLPLDADVVVTDPPYLGYEYPWPVPEIDKLALPSCRGFYFWPTIGDFPLKHSAIHLWSKCNVNIGKQERYEVIYEVNGNSGGRVFRHGVINSDMNAQLNGDQFFKHPTQKPIRLMERIVELVKGTVLDPFMGSGTTGVACARLGRPFVGIEQDADYFEIACSRIRAAHSQLRLFA